MTRRMIVRPAAEQDLVEARDWYETQRAGLGFEFLDAISDCFARIRVFPESCAVIYRKVRPAVLSRFPYVVYFRLVGEEIEVLAVLHGGRDPNQWKSRT